MNGLNAQQEKALNSLVSWLVYTWDKGQHSFEKDDLIDQVWLFLLERKAVGLPTPTIQEIRWMLNKYVIQVLRDGIDRRGVFTIQEVWDNASMDVAFPVYDRGFNNVDDLDFIRTISQGLNLDETYVVLRRLLGDEENRKWERIGTDMGIHPGWAAHIHVNAMKKMRSLSTDNREKS